MDPDALRADMTPWPESWAGSDDDLPFGRDLVAAFGPFIQHLCEAGLSRKTVRSHLNSLWVMSTPSCENSGHPRSCWAPSSTAKHPWPPMA